MFSLYKMPSAERFLEVVEEASGSVYLHLPDNSLVDLKEDRTARQLLQTMTLGPKGLSFSLSQPSDLPKFVRYMEDSCYDKQESR